MGMNPRLLRPILSGDADALRYIAAVQAADGQSLEPAVRKAITDFVVGCKVDGIWSAIKACCLLAGPHSLLGINVPLVGPTPTFNAFTATEYTRKTGLLGNGSTMFIDSQRDNDADGQDDHHMAVWIAQATTTTGAYIGNGRTANGSTHCGRNNSVNADFSRSRTNTADTFVGGVYASAGTGFMGISRNNSATYNFRTRSTDNSLSRTSQTPRTGTVHVFGQNDTTPDRTNGRLAFYSVGSSITLSLLESRVSAYVTAIDAAL